MSLRDGRDGAVRVWDVRQRDAPVACFEPGEGVKARDCWSVAFGRDGILSRKP